MSELSPSPVWLWIDPTRRCNLACTLCYTKASHADYDLSPEALRQFLGQFVEAGLSIKELTFNWRGEPLMNKRYVELLSIADRMLPNTPLQFHTNAMLLTEQLSSAIVAASNRLRIFVSIDGGNRESHERNRGVETFEKSIAGAWHLLKARGNAITPKIILYQIDLGVPPSLYDPKFVQLSKAVDSHIKVFPVVDNGEEKGLAFGFGAVSPVKTDSCDLDKQRRIPTKACFWAGNSLAVDPNGDVSICILSNSKDGVIGNMNSDSLIAILERAKEWRLRLNEKGRGSVKHCANCLKCEGDGNGGCT